MSILIKYHMKCGKNLAKKKQECLDAMVVEYELMQENGTDSLSSDTKKKNKS